MAGAALTVEVLDTELGVRQKYTFERTPVRVGRSPLNDLPLDRPFVSHCHGVFHFDEARCQFVDLGSTNGTFLGSRQLVKNQPVAIPPGTPLVIGALELHVAREASSLADTRTSYAFRPSGIQDAVKAPPAAASPVSHGPAGVAASPDARDLVRLAKQYRKSWDALMAALIQRAASGVPREKIAGELLRHCPELAQEAEFRRWLGTDRSSKAAPPPQGHDAFGASVDKMREVLEHFAQTFIELRRGQRHFGSQIGVSSAGDEPLAGVEDAGELLRFLLDPRASSDRMDELSRAFADLMLHQVALLNAFQAGARELLAFLSPEALVKRSRGGIMAFVGRMFGRDPRLEALQRSLEDLSEDTTLANLLMGRAFARAYASAMGQRPTSGSDPAERVHTGRL